MIRLKRVGWGILWAGLWSGLYLWVRGWGMYWAFGVAGMMTCAYLCLLGRCLALLFLPPIVPYAMRYYR